MATAPGNAPGTPPAQHPNQQPANPAQPATRPDEKTIPPGSTDPGNPQVADDPADPNKRDRDHERDPRQR